MEPAPRTRREPDEKGIGAISRRRGCARGLGRDGRLRPRQQHCLFPLFRDGTRFRAALSYPDTVSIGARVANVGEDRFVMRYAVYSHRLGRLAAEGEGTLVCFDYRQNRKAPVPEKLRARIAELQAGGS
ncbi:MAG: thioesterase family protein [Syntrophales bacterium]|nr:thioesterase family protein [Syntrophales bacterium]